MAESKPVVRFRQETYVDGEGRVMLALHPLEGGPVVYRGRGVAHVTMGPYSADVPYDFVIPAATPDEAFDAYDAASQSGHNASWVKARAQEMIQAKMVQQQGRTVMAQPGLVDASGQPIARRPVGVL
jgi:hypothetical protein